MMLRRIMVFAVGVCLFGCGSSGARVVGTWDGSFKGADISLTARSDSSFAMGGISKMRGRWEFSGHDLRLFKDIRNGGDAEFGDGGDGAMHLTLSADGKELTGNASDGSPLVLRKK